MEVAGARVDGDTFEALYGAAQFSRNTDIVLATDAANEAYRRPLLAEQAVMEVAVEWRRTDDAPGSWQLPGASRVLAA